MYVFNNVCIMIIMIIIFGIIIIIFTRIHVIHWI